MQGDGQKQKLEEHQACSIGLSFTTAHGKASYYYYYTTLQMTHFN
jgi:hypothetical protein